MSAGRAGGKIAAKNQPFASVELKAGAIIILELKIAIALGRSQH
ncbi:MAG: hypothetical protein ACLFV6_15995 [Spirulinaceae cyanobacterium]